MHQDGGKVIKDLGNFFDKFGQSTAKRQEFVQLTSTPYDYKCDCELFIAFVVTEDTVAGFVTKLL